MISAQTSGRNDIGGLSHLVEAATALTELVDSSQSSAPNMSTGRSDQRSVVSDDDDERGKQSSGKGKKREIFPEKLMEILSDKTLSDVVSWLPHGRSFVIIRPDIFTDQVMTKYLPPADARASTKYPSFTRKLNRWGFRQATRGPDTGAFHHPLFRRDQPDLCLQMACQKSRERKDAQKRSLPPKKRAVSDKAPKTVGESGAAIQGKSILPPSTSTMEAISVPSVSADDRSVNSSANSSVTNLSANSIGPKPAPVSIGGGVGQHNNVEPSLLPFISNDAAFVASVLRRRDAEESIKVARAMLYDAYIKAIGSN